MKNCVTHGGRASPRAAAERGSVLMEYCLVNLFIGCGIVLLWHVCFYTPEEGWKDATQEDAASAQLAVGGSAEAVDMQGSSGKMLVDFYRRVLSGIAMPFP